MARADYIHRTEQIQKHDVLVIEDLDLGNMSVTNSIEEVIAEIEQMEGIKANDYIIIYKDSDGTYDAFQSGEFMSLGADNVKEAIRTYNMKFLQQIN